jgi:hypothetical protein
MKKKIAPMWVLEEIKSISTGVVDIFDHKAVVSYMESVGKMFMVEWLLRNKELYTYCILSNQYEDPGFYHEGLR